jgi:hypothetical protein
MVLVIVELRQKRYFMIKACKNAKCQNSFNVSSSVVVERCFSFRDLSAKVESENYNTITAR